MTPNLDEVRGGTLVEAVDSLFAEHVRSLIKNWPSCPAHTRNVLEWSITTQWWESVWLTSEPRYILPRSEAASSEQYVPKPMLEKLATLLHEAIKPLLSSIVEGELTLSGLEELGVNTGWDRLTIPRGAVDACQCILERGGSRVWIPGGGPAWANVRVGGRVAQKDASVQLDGPDLAPYPSQAPISFKARFSVADWPLLVEMRKAILRGDAATTKSAARSVADKSAGSGTVDSRQQRLEREYREISWGKLEGAAD